MSDVERISHIRSPDGTFRIVQRWKWGDRAPDWQRTCILAEPSGRVLVDLPLFEVAGEPAFPGPGQVLLMLRHRYGQQVHIADVSHFVTPGGRSIARLAIVAPASTFRNA